MSHWETTRFVVVNVVDDKGHTRPTVWDTTEGKSVPHPRGKRRRYTMREAFSIADALNQHPAFRTNN